jgi:hypothetical protein
MMTSQEKTGSTESTRRMKRDKQLQREWHVKLGDEEKQPRTAPT